MHGGGVLLNGWRGNAGSSAVAAAHRRGGKRGCCPDDEPERHGSTRRGE
ncbi:hypothetical protein [Lysobacter gummosus]